MKNLVAKRLEAVKNHYNQTGADLLWPACQYRAILAHYYRLIIPSDASILEVGCGSGELLAQLPNRDITGVDFSEKQITARSYTNIACTNIACPKGGGNKSLRYPCVIINGVR